MRAGQWENEISREIPRVEALYTRLQEHIF
jgi:hypothetical protein